MRSRRLLPVRRSVVTAATTAGALVAAGALASCTPVDSGGDSGSGSGSGSGSARGEAFGSPAEASQVKEGGTLTVALSAEPDMLDPTQSRSLYSRYVFQAMCQKLYDVDQDARVVPQLATALPEVSDGGRTVTMSLRTGVKFADGTAFDSAAVKTTLQRHLTLDTSGRVTDLGPITTIDTPDASTVVVHLRQPFAPLTAALADRAGMIMSPKALTKLGKDFGSNPTCVGPFKFAKRVPQNSIELVKDPNFYDADKVHLDKISYRILTDASIRAANLRSGDAQVADTLSTQDVGALSKESDVEVLQSSSLGYQGFTFNVGNVKGVGTPAEPVDTPVGKSALVRRAFEYAVDRTGLNKAVFNGLYDTACSPISPASELSSPAAQKCFPHDPAKAKALIKEAGVTAPVPLTMLTANTPDSLRLAQALQSMVKEGGFDMKIKPVEYTSLLDAQDQGDFESLQLGWSGRVDPDANITSFVGTGGSLNVSGYNDKTVDALLEKARQSTDVAERRTLYGQAITKLHDDEPIVYLYRQRNLTGVSTSVKGVQVFPDGVIRVAFAGLAK
jgi:peptide/nickel transport system substrate-binding protein